MKVSYFTVTMHEIRVNVQEMYVLKNLKSFYSHPRLCLWRRNIISKNIQQLKKLKGKKIVSRQISSMDIFDKVKVRFKLLFGDRSCQKCYIFDSVIFWFLFRRMSTYKSTFNNFELRINSINFMLKHF